MEVLDRISEKEEDYYRYLSRLNFERQQRTLENDMERERTLKEQALAEKERALAQEERALAQEGRALKEVEQLRAQLRALGVDPDTSA